MNQMTDLDLVRRTTSLQTLALGLRKAMKRRWPEIDFDADIWPIRTRYKTSMNDVRFGATIASFNGWDSDYLLAQRCLVASSALEGKSANWGTLERSWRLLSIHSIPEVPLAALRRHHLQDIEDKAVREATPRSASAVNSSLRALATHLDYLGRQGVVDRFMWQSSVKTKGILNKLARERGKVFKSEKAEVLDRQIEAFSEVTSAMLRQDGRLDQVDRSAVALSNILMCAPSRINEALTCKISDRFTIEDYARRSEDRETSTVHSTHQLLLMKGSKGAQWSPKPILNFMIDLVEKCWQILLDGGKRSRMLVIWYEQHPDQLYLPPELEHLRSQPLSRLSIWQIVNLTTNEPSKEQLSSISINYWIHVVDPKDGRTPAEVLKIDPMRPRRADGTKASKIEALPWEPVEAYLLKEVRGRIERMRRVTVRNHYAGPLGEMLVLVDVNYTPYLPQALSDATVRSRLNSKENQQPSIFVKLGLRMSQGGKEVDCYLNSHDPRRWLTTQALAARERLSDVLINKWANRLCLGQLQAYDLRSDEQKAEQAATPLPSELTDLSESLQELEEQASQYGLSTEIVVAHGQGISVTSMEAVCKATEDRPVARTGGQILILYPTRFGACVHQHHEKPCRSYVCTPCDEQRTVKGHMPTNEEWRKEANLTNRSIINQLLVLITARNRGVADDPQMFDAHLMTLVQQGLDPQTMADDLIDRFHEIRDQIRDLSFRNELEQAFVSRGVVKRLDDPEIPNGALIKYHNPKRHAAPGHELAMEAHFGSSEDMHRQSELFYEQHPELAPADLGLQDERHLLDGDEDDEGSEYDQAA